MYFYNIFYKDGESIEKRTFFSFVPLYIGLYINVYSILSKYIKDNFSTFAIISHNKTDIPEIIALTIKAQNRSKTEKIQMKKAYVKNSPLTIIDQYIVEPNSELDFNFEINISEYSFQKHTTTEIIIEYHQAGKTNKETIYHGT